MVPSAVTSPFSCSSGIAGVGEELLGINGSASGFAAGMLGEPDGRVKNGWAFGLKLKLKLELLGLRRGAALFGLDCGELLAVAAFLVEPRFRVAGL